MKAQAALFFFFILIPSLCGSQDMFFLPSLSHVPMSEQIVIGRLDEGVILPCSFESGPDVVVHWKNQDNYAYSYYKDRDQLEKQDPRYVNRTSLFLGEIHNGNASLSFKRLKLQDEGTYICYVGTSLGKIINKVVLKVGAFVTPVMKYEKNTTNSFLICNVLSVYPYPIITWKVDNTPISENNKEEIGSLGPFYINSRVNITGSNSSYQCAIENTLLKQTWTGRWTRKDGLRKKQRENVSLSCKPENSFFLPNEDFRVTWSRVDSGNSLVLAQFLNSSQETIINEPLLSRNKDLINLHDFSLTLKDLHLSDSGEYLCNISSSKYTLLTIQTLHVAYRLFVEASQETVVGTISTLVAVMVAILLLLTLAVKSRRCGYYYTEGHPSTDQRSSHDGTAEENVVRHFLYQTIYSIRMLP
ncbi:HERV-H LTR-associating protein 2 isoform X1 [Neophocaena asiaeorientalis asiaeorientalis]|uniref:HERV-H LTR-associating protein 2 isoform X1 n=1 Tax=Neophocaena asiaeorientalis asiaeorientalis TaxID=1706337 RepID=A0A341ANJ7_NEOAA|nr:HERV-H LTR-associating protein 2 isoform X1 [Neophocaena asiaeorientalis asiaeorientalis]XP_024591174.1 HERV-H LTR-associating protein 2 isoform X1 [Neophocaena asiaeorientalis asiaeorientalis]